MINRLWDVFVILLIGGLVAQFVLLIVRFDYFQDISFYWINTPVWIVAGIGVVLGFISAVYYPQLSRRPNYVNRVRSIQGFIVGVGSLGFGVTTYMLARKFEFDSDVTFLVATTPLFASLLPIGIAVLTLMVMHPPRIRKKVSK